MERKNELPIFSGLVWLLLTFSFTTNTAAQQYTQQNYKSNLQETTQSAVGVNAFDGTSSNQKPVEVLYTS
ncbi:MAG: hypothetical protein WBN55_05115, partial [Eudoraea sp.]|uniref:hypothetical protein n=1 Tax=Eudoraea sp. TaxID=1979955 RepID=UPI003C7789DE